MKSHFAKKVFTIFITAVILVNPLQVIAQDSGAPGGIFDESVKDLTLVLGTGLGGAILGLSTLSFADEPKDHTKNIAIGGAIGVVVGVGIVIFGQATKSQTIVTDASIHPMDAQKVASLARSEFSKQKIAADFFMTPTFEYNFTF